MSQNPYGLILTVRTDSDTKKALKGIAKKLDLTLTQVIRKAMKDLIAKEKP